MQDPSSANEQTDPSTPDASGADDEVLDAHFDAPEVKTGTPVRSLPEAKAVTKQRARDARSLLARYIRRHLPTPPEKPTRLDEPPRFVGSFARWLPVLRVIPTVLVLLFVASFFWDFDGMSIYLFGRERVLEGLLLTVSVSGLIGFATNWLAITMLFRPQERRPIVPQGLIPSQRERVIYRLAKAVSEELINAEIIKQKIEESGVIPRYRDLALGVTRGVLEDPEFRDELKALTASYAREVLSSEAVRRKIIDFTVEKLQEHADKGWSGVALRFYRLVNEQDFQRRIEEAVDALPESVDVALDEMDHLLDRVPAQIEARSEDIEQWATQAILGFVENLDVYSIVVDNMRQYDEQQLENLLKNTSNEQLNYIKYLGGVLGFFGGLVIWQPILALTIFGTLGLTLWGLDELLYRAQQSPR